MVDDLHHSVFKYAQIGDHRFSIEVAFEKLSFCVRPIGSFERIPTDQSEYGIQVSQLNLRSHGTDDKYAALPRRVGSTVLLEYEKTYFAVFTRHQFNQLREGKFVKEAIEETFIYVDYDGGTSNIPIADLLFTDTQTEDDLNDLVVAVLQPTPWNGSQTTYFFPVFNSDNFAIGTTVLAVGFRYKEDHDSLAHSLSTNDITCLSGKAACYYKNQQNMFGSMTYVANGESLDGMSGGGVFTIEIYQGDLKLSFAGMIVRGGNGTIYFISSQRIIDILRDYMHRKFFRDANV